MVAERSITCCGLPESGKSTFLAALWHLVTARELQTALEFESLRDGDQTHLNAIAARWRSAKVQERTLLGNQRVVTMNLRDAKRGPLRLTFPDLSGESYRRMWEERACDAEIAALLKARTD